MSATLVPTAEQIETLRDLFFKKLDREGAPFEDGFDQRDLNRIQNTDKFLQNFLEGCDLDMKQSLNMLWDTCTWRKEFGTNDLTEHNINQDLLNSGIIFPHNRDIDGKVLLIFKTKLHQKGKNHIDESIRILVYWIERLQRQENYEQITILFDMNGTGLGHMDMEFTKRTIDTFKFYYPHSLNFIIIYDMPWILSAAFKIVKSLLPPKAVAKMKFVNSKTMADFIDESNMLTGWGGTDDYEYSFVSDNRQPASEQYVNINNNYQAVTTTAAATITTTKNSDDVNDPVFLSARKVHFANSSPPESPMSEISQSTITGKAEAELLRITPDDAIVFTKSGTELVGTVDIINISQTTITYKIKTTSPEKFRVRPSSGCLSPGANTSINVVLQQGQLPSTLNKDKFLVMSMPLTPDSPTSTLAIADLWKNTPTNSPSVEQRRLKCTLPQQLISGDGLKNGRLSTNNFGNAIDGGDRQLNSVLSQLTETTTRLEHQVKFSQNLQWITLCVFLLLSMAVVYILKQEINQSSSCSPHHSEL